MKVRIFSVDLKTWWSIGQKQLKRGPGRRLSDLKVKLKT